MSTMRYTFDEVKQKRTVATFCPECKKSVTRIISTSYFRNGLHDESKTRAANDRQLDKEAALLGKSGATCRACKIAGK